MKKNSDFNSKFNYKIYNQDNNGAQMHPIIQKPAVKIIFCLIYISIFLEVFFNIDKIDKVRMLFYTIHLYIALVAIIFFICNKIKTIIFIKIKEREIRKQNEINFEYYREILDEFSPGVLAFCYNKKLKYEDAIISTLLSLNNKYIKLNMLNKTIHVLPDGKDNNLKEKKGIYILPDKKYINLKEHEMYLLEKLKDFSSDITFQELKEIVKDTYFKSNFLNLIKFDCKISGYYETFHRSNKLLSRIFLILVCIFWVSVGANSDGVYKDIIFVNITDMIFLGILMFLNNKNTYMITNKGYEIKAKLKGLKKYLLDYSSINDRDISEITIWEHYILYAIILDLKGNLDKEVSNFYKEFS